MSSTVSHREGRECEGGVCAVGHLIPISKAMRLDVEYSKAEHVDYTSMELKETEGTRHLLSSHRMAKKFSEKLVNWYVHHG